MSEIRDALRAVRDREPVELEEGVTPDRVVKLALDVLDLGYRAHGENARASLPAVQIDWMMQRWADAEERAATADRDASDYANAMDARLADALDMERQRAERDAARAEAEALRHAIRIAGDAFRSAEEAERRRDEHLRKHPICIGAARPSSPTTGGAA